MMWKEVKIGNVLKVTSGGTPSRKKPEYYKDGVIPWIKTGDLKRRLITEPSECITELGLKYSSAKLFPPKTVLLAMYGATIGACSILGIEASTNQACAALLPSQKCDENFLYYFLKSKREDLIGKGVGGAQPNISGGIIKDTLIPLPPLEEQKKIAAILDAADALRQKDKALIAKYEELTQSLFLDMFGDPVTNPEGLRLSLAKNVLSIKMGPFGSLLHKEDYVENEIPLINPSHIEDYRIKPDNKLTITKEKAKELNSYILKEGDLVLGRRGEIGRCAVVTKKENGFLCGTGSMLLRPKPGEINSAFLSYLFSCSQFRSLLESKAKGITMKNLSGTIVGNISFPIPPISLQNQFAERVHEIEKQKQLAQQSLQKSEELFDRLLQKAFKGELTKTLEPA